MCILHNGSANFAVAKAGRRWYNAWKGGVFLKDFPIFDTESGISSLILREIPYRREAYIHIQSVQPEGFWDHLHQCVSFCRMVGAEKIYAEGHEALTAYPLHAAIREMRGPAWVDGEKLNSLFPVTEATVARWREICNDRLRGVDHAATLTAADEEKILQSGGAYFVHRDGELLGVGWLEDTRLLLVAGAKPGAGEAVMHTLMSLVEGADMTLEVASTNHRAIALYERLGFVPVGERLCWYDVSQAREEKEAGVQ